MYQENKRGNQSRQHTSFDFFHLMMSKQVKNIATVALKKEPL